LLLLLLNRDATLMLLLSRVLRLLTNTIMLLLRLVGPAVCAVLLLMMPGWGFLQDWVQLPSKC
jgi:hypothetical protein